MKIEHQEILSAFQQFKEVREVFAKYEGKWFSGNDNHIGDIGEYWAMRYFEDRNPKIAPSRTSNYDIELGDGTRLSVKTMSEWNKRGQGGPVKGIDSAFWNYLVAVKLDNDLNVEKFCIVPHEQVKKRGIKERKPFRWWSWLDEFSKPFSIAQGDA